MPQYPTSYNEAKALLKGKFSKRLSANTRLRLEDNGNISVILHDTAIVIFFESGHIILNSGGWQTVTTKRRINQCLPEGYRLSQKKHIWYLNQLHFVDGFGFNPEQGLGCKVVVSA